MNQPEQLLSHASDWDNADGFSRVFPEDTNYFFFSRIQIFFHEDTNFWLYIFFLFFFLIP